ncbi:glycosyltransferase family 9 protein [Oleidesulfovibrio sp.]|uniref:glycosyltransferase family 9 protein n=1 Tax=Oleidesulfovibrio sp. TaxID=2909707 RepID=UPI003A84A662
MKKALVIQLARFGDIIQTKRLVLTLLRRFDEVHIAVDDSLKSLTSMVYPAACVHGLAVHSATCPTDVLSRNVKSFGKLAGIQFDAVYNLNFSRLSMALSALFDAESVHGYRMEAGQPVVPEWPRLAFRWTKKRRLAPVNLVDFWAGFASRPISAGEVNPIASRKGGGIGVVLAGRESRRSLPPNVLARCVKAVFEGLDGPKITLLGSKAESALARQVQRHFSGPMVERTENLAGRTDYAALAEVVDTFDTLLTPDTGTMHLAAHLGTPVQSFFLSSAWCFETGPYGMGHRVWQGIVECTPCEEARPCPVNVACLNAFSDERFLKVLAGRFGDEYPPAMMGLVSVLDDVGTTYLPVFGEDAAASARRQLRLLLADYLSRGVESSSAAMLGVFDDGSNHSHELAQMIFSESDWMLGYDDSAEFAGGGA